MVAEDARLGDLELQEVQSALRASGVGGFTESNTLVVAQDPWASAARQRGIGAVAYPELSSLEATHALRSQLHYLLKAQYNQDEVLTYLQIVHFDIWPNRRKDEDEVRTSFARV